MKIFKNFVLAIFIIFSLCFAFVAGSLWAVKFLISPVGGQKNVRIEVPQGATARQIGERLEKAGLIRSSLLFRAIVRYTGSGTTFRPGIYMISPDDNLLDILGQLKKGVGRLRLVTIPEGLTLKQVAQQLEKSGVVNAGDFLRTVEESAFKIDGKIPQSLEGYLLPETYDFPERFKSGDILKTMVDAFNTRVAPLYQDRKDSLPMKMSLGQVVTLASLVEREAKRPEERPIIASVYYNRLKKGMMLQCDATVQYALGEQKKYLKLSDLKINSPYNTYVHKGLPPGPIANPGIQSIRAVLEPKTTNYLFYVRNDVKNDGSHVFSTTFGEHNKAIKKYQK
jgi:UPF0755 protein